MEKSNHNAKSKSVGSGQAVTVVIGSHSVRWLVIGILVLIALILWTDRVSVGADLKANQAIKASEDQSAESRVAAFWMERAKVACETHGVPMPDLPPIRKGH